MKIVVFDLDETLGSFVELGIFWDCLNRYLIKDPKKELLKDDFSNVLDLYPEFLRPGIIDILNYLKNKKISNCCKKLMIYTNNQGPESWAKNLINYFEQKLNHPLFDQIIAAFKINGKRVEICRSSHDKSYNDLIKCTKLPKTAEFCFIDDVYHPKMHNKNIYYINLKPYTYDLPFEQMIDRFMHSELGKKYLNKEDHTIFLNYMNKELKLYNYSCVEKKKDDYEIDKILSKQILIYLQDFFNKKPRIIQSSGSSSSKNKTKKNKMYANKTRKYKY